MKVVFKKNAIYIYELAPTQPQSKSSKNISTPPKPRASENPTRLLSIKRGTALNIDTTIPNLTTIHHPQLTINNQTVDISDNFSYNYGSLHINVIPILEELGYESRFKQNRLILKKHNIQYLFEDNSASLNITSSKEKKSKKLNYLPRIVNNKAFFSYSSLCQRYGIHHTLECQNRYS